MKVSPFEFEAAPAGASRSAGERRDGDVPREMRASAEGKEEEQPSEDLPDEPGYGHGV